jgi:hypothetical protein
VIRLTRCDPPPEPYTPGPTEAFTNKAGWTFEGVVAGDGEYYERGTRGTAVQWFRLEDSEEEDA